MHLVQTQSRFEDGEVANTISSGGSVKGLLPVLEPIRSNDPRPALLPQREDPSLDQPNHPSRVLGRQHPLPLHRDIEMHDELIRHEHIPLDPPHERHPPPISQGLDARADVGGIDGRGGGDVVVGIHGPELLQRRDILLEIPRQRHGIHPRRIQGLQPLQGLLVPPHRHHECPHRQRDLDRRPAKPAGGRGNDDALPGFEVDIRQAAVGHTQPHHPSEILDREAKPALRRRSQQLALVEASADLQGQAGILGEGEIPELARHELVAAVGEAVADATEEDGVLVVPAPDAAVRVDEIARLQHDRVVAHGHHPPDRRGAGHEGRGVRVEPAAIVDFPGVGQDGHGEHADDGAAGAGDRGRDRSEMEGLVVGVLHKGGVLGWEGDGDGHDVRASFLDGRRVCVGV